MGAIYTYDAMSEGKVGSGGMGAGVSLDVNQIVGKDLARVLFQLDHMTGSEKNFWKK